MFFGLPKEVGGVLWMPHFSPEMVWHTLLFSIYVHIYIHACIQPGPGETKAEIFS